MKPNWNPSTVHRALTPQFLTPIADAVWRVQHAVTGHVQPQHGDDEWVAGCIAYKRRCFALMKMARGPERDWLWAGFIENQFTIRILGFPIRIYRAPNEGGVPMKYADGSDSEMALLGRALALDLKDAPGVLYRVEVQTGKLGRPLRVLLVEINEHGAITNSYAIPRSVASELRLEPQTRTVSPMRRRKPPVVPPATEVKSNTDREQDDNSAEQGEKPA